MFLHTAVSKKVVSFGGFDGESVRQEANRQAAGAVFRSLASQIFLLVAVVAMSGIALSLFWAEVTRYESALRNCAGV